MLQGHHISYGGMKKNDALYNRLALCFTHHRMLHAGILRVTGCSPFPLLWTLGRDKMAVRLIGERYLYEEGGVTLHAGLGLRADGDLPWEAPRRE
jgi:hypothetical protein